MNWIDQLERKYRKYAIANLMSYIMGGCAIVYFLSFVDSSIISLLMYDTSKILQGEIWRVLTFIFIPPSTGILGIIMLFLYYSIGRNLEMEWGSFRFNFYYFFGMINIVISGILIKLLFNVGISVDNYYLYMSLFLAFARLFPDFTLRLYFILPIKIKYIGWITWGFIALSFFTGGVLTWISIFFSFLNYFVFFLPDIIRGRKVAINSSARKREFRASNRAGEKSSLHKCSVCGRTEKDDPNLEFRYCSKCDGDYEYCMEHLFTHDHK